MLRCRLSHVLIYAVVSNMPERVWFCGVPKENSTFLQTLFQRNASEDISTDCSGIGKGGQDVDYSKIFL